MPTRQRTIELKVLKILKDCQEYMLPEESLSDQLHAAIRPPVIQHEITAAIAKLDSKLQILGVRDDDQIKWKITDRGIAELFEAEHV